MYFIKKLFGILTYPHKCPDGTTRTIYYNVNDAIPLDIKGIDADISIDIDDMKLEGKVKKDVKALLYQVDDSNSSLVLHYRQIYLAYQSDPCGDMNFAIENRKIQNKHLELQEYRMALLTLIELLKTGNNPNELIKTFCNNVGQLNGKNTPCLRQEVTKEFKKAENDVKQLIGVNNES